MSVQDIISKSISACDSIKDKEKRIACKIDLLKDTARAQEHVLYGIRDEFGNDPLENDVRRSIAVMMGWLNAPIIHIANRGLNPKSVDWSYVKQKLDYAFDNAKWVQRIKPELKW